MYEQKCWTCENCTYSECLWIRSKGTKHIKGTQLNEKGFITYCPKYKEEILTNNLMFHNIDLTLYGLTKKQSYKAYYLYNKSKKAKSLYKTFEDYLLRYAIAKQDGLKRTMLTDNQILMQKYSLTIKQFYNAYKTYNHSAKITQKYKTFENYLKYYSLTHNKNLTRENYKK